MDAKAGRGARASDWLYRLLKGRETWVLADQAIVSATNFLTNVMLARFMGLREFGIFALAWMSVLFVNSIQYALIISPMMSIGPKQQEKDRPAYFGAAAFQELVLVTVCFVLVFAALDLASSLFRQLQLQHLAWPLAVSALAYQMQDFIRRYFFATRQSRHVLVDDTLSYVTQLPIILLLHMYGHLNGANALWAMAGTSILGVLIGWLWIEPLEFKWDWIKAISQRHWALSRWLVASALLQWTSTNFFVIVAPVYFGPAAAGVLKASQNLMGVTHIWFLGLDNVIPVETARRLREGGVPSMLAYTRSILMRWGGLTLLFAIVIGIAPAFWLRLIYGFDMLQYSYILRLYALTYVLIFAGGPLRAGLLALEFTQPLFWSYLAMTAFALIFAAPLAKKLQLEGTMMGLIGTQIISQSIIGATLFLKSRVVVREQGLSRQLLIPIE
jgi:O-antigen/teichoic acid export membrane protein